jgi:hypothetical protein
MKKSTPTLSFLVVLALQSAVRAAPPDLMGSDTLEALTRDLVTSDCRSFLPPPNDTTVDSSNNSQLKAFLNYVGGGSGTAASAMISQLTGGSQQVAGPMSRAFNAAECNTAESAKPGTKATAQGVVIGLDGIVVVSDSQHTETCGGGHTVHGDDSQPGPKFSNLPVITATWKQQLKTLYTGYDAANSAQDCKSAARQALAADYKSMFDAGCTDSTVCPGGMTHAFRRGDRSGTTDTFLSLIGAPSITLAIDPFTNLFSVTKTPFCNGKEGEDNDPIRRTCLPSEQVCEYDGTLGLVLPIVVPTNTNETAALYNASNTSDPAVSPVYHNVDPVNGDVAFFGKFKTVRGTACADPPNAQLVDPVGNLAVASGTSVGYNLPAGYKFPNSPRCDCRFPTPEDYANAVDGSGVASPFPKNLHFSWNKRYQNRCWGAYHPNSGSDTNVRWGVLNGDDGIGDNAPSVWGNKFPVSGATRCCRTGSPATFYKMEPRLMNLALRNPINTDGRLLGAETGGPGELKWATITAFYRIHSNGLGLTAVPNRNLTLTQIPPNFSGLSLCQEQDATRQIACLVQYASTCSYGYAGREAGDSTVSVTAEPFAVGGVSPTIVNIQKLISGGLPYPLARRLYYNTLIGFGTSPLVNPNGAATSYETAQFNLYKCMADIVSPRDSGIAASIAALDTAGFVELPASQPDATHPSGLPKGPKMCNNMCTTNTTCAVLDAVPSADLLPALLP